MPAAVVAFSALTFIGGACACRTASSAIRTAFVFLHELSIRPVAAVLLPASGHPACVDIIAGGDFDPSQQRTFTVLASTAMLTTGYRGEV